MKKIVTILSLLLIAIPGFTQENRIKPEKNIIQAPAANYIMLSDVSGNFQIVPSNTLPGGGGDVIQSVTYDGDVFSITTDQGVFNININANTVETTAPISINGNVYPAGTDIQTLLGVVGVAINNISLVDNGDGTYTFTDTDGNTVTINTGGGVSQAAFYKKVLFNESYSLPYDTIHKYDILTISVQTGGPFDQVITFPDLPDDIDNGKIIVLNFDSGSEISDDVTVQGTGNSVLIQSNCYQEGRTEQADVFSIDYDNPLTVIYHTAYFDDYYRQCDAEVLTNLAVTDQIVTAGTNRYILADGPFENTSLNIGYVDDPAGDDNFHLSSDFTTAIRIGQNYNGMFWNDGGNYSSSFVDGTVKLWYRNNEAVVNAGSGEVWNRFELDLQGIDFTSRNLTNIAVTSEGNIGIKAVDSLTISIGDYELLKMGSASDSLIKFYDKYAFPDDTPSTGTSSVFWKNGKPRMETDGIVQTYNAGGGATSVASATPEKINGDTPGINTTIIATGGWTTTPGRISWEGRDTIIAEIKVQLSISTTGASDMEYFIAQNGVVIPYTRGSLKHAVSDIGAVSLSSFIELAPTDYIEVWCKPSSGTEDIVIQDMTIMCAIAEWQ